MTFQEYKDLKLQFYDVPRLVEELEKDSTLIGSVGIGIEKRNGVEDTVK